MRRGDFSGFFLKKRFSGKIFGSFLNSFEREEDFLLVFFVDFLFIESFHSRFELEKRKKILKRRLVYFKVRFLVDSEEEIVCVGIHFFVLYY